MDGPQASTKSTMLTSLKPPEDKADVSIQEVLKEIEREGTPPSSVGPPPSSVGLQTCSVGPPPCSVAVPPVYAPQSVYVPPQMYPSHAPPPLPSSTSAEPMTIPSSKPTDTGILGGLKKHQTSILLVLLYFGFSFLKLSNLLNLQNLTLLQRIPSSMMAIKAVLFVLSYNLLNKNLL